MSVVFVKWGDKRVGIVRADGSIKVILEVIEVKDEYGGHYWVFDSNEGGAIKESGG